MQKKMHKCPKFVKIGLIYLALVLIYVFLSIFDKQLYSLFALNLPENIKNAVFFIQEDWIFFPIIFIFGLFCIGLKKEKKKLKRKNLISFIISVGIAMLIAFIFKNTIYKSRPDSTLGFDSFPSGHATLMFTLFPFLKENSKIIKIIYIIFTALILISRFIFGYHYLSDLFAGAILGYSISLLIGNIIIKK